MTDPFPSQTYDPADDAPLSQATVDKLNRLAAAVDDVDVQDTKGDLLGHDGTRHLRIPIGPNGTLLAADDTRSGGLSWLPVAMQSIEAMDTTIAIAGTPQNPTIGVDTIAESQVRGLLADLATKVPLSAPTAVLAASSAVAGNQIVLADTSHGSWTASLPAAPPDQTRITIKIVAAAPGNLLSVVTGAGDHFSLPTGPTSRTLSLLGEAITAQYVAATATWLVLSVDVPVTQLDGRYVAQATSSQLVLVPSTVTFTPTAATTWFVNLQATVTGSSISPAPPANTSVPLTIVWVQDATGGRTYAWPPSCRFAGGTAPSDTTPNSRTSVTFAWDGTYWIETARAVAVR